MTQIDRPSASAAAPSASPLEASLDQTLRALAAGGDKEELLKGLPPLEQGRLLGALDALVDAPLDAVGQMTKTPGQKQVETNQSAIESQTYWRALGRAQVDQSMAPYVKRDHPADPTASSVSVRSAADPS